MAIPLVANLNPSAIGADAVRNQPFSGHESFLDTIQSALGAVSQAQGAATEAESAVAAGKPGASQATALVLSDRAEIGWTGVVAVRNEVVAAYQTLTNMQI